MADYRNHRVQKFSPDGLFITKFGRFGSDAGQLNRPHGLCVSTDGKVYVADTDNNRIQVFSASDAENGYLVTSDLWIRAVINSVEKGPIEAVWKKGGEDTTSAGDRVIWGHFYASPDDVTYIPHLFFASKIILISLSRSGLITMAGWM